MRRLFYFLPAAGNRDCTILDNAGSFGHYWSSSLYTGNPYVSRVVHNLLFRQWIGEQQLP